jgi:mannosyltransferase OCH1-like enzyme
MATQEPCSAIIEPHPEPGYSSSLFSRNISYPAAQRRFSWEAKISEQDLISKYVIKGKVSKIIHQSWKNTTLPKHIDRWSQQWKKKHKNYVHLLWTDEDNRLLVEKHYPEYLLIYDMFPRKIHRIDIVRCIYLHFYGGLYADLDMIVVKDNTPLFDQNPDKDVFLARISSDDTFEHNVPNAWMASKPNHPFWLQTLFIAAQRSFPYAAFAEIVTGPVMIMDAYKFWERIHGKDSGVFVFPEGYIYGINWNGVNPIECDFGFHIATDEQFTECFTAFPKLYALTVWTHSWE